MFFEKTSSLGFVYIATDVPLGWMFFAFILCTVAILDIIINDICPNTINIITLYNYRHIIYMLMAVLSISLSVAVIVTNGPSFSLCRLWLDGAVATLVAFLDIRERYRNYCGKQIYFRLS
jgi:hypothetical protein